MIPGQKDFLFVPLGGCGEIGMNLNLFGHAGQWLMVDCGITFEKDDANLRWWQSSRNARPDIY